MDLLLQVLMVSLSRRLHSASIGVVPGSRSASLTGTSTIPSHSSELSMICQQQPISRSPSPYPGYHYNSDEMESQLPDSYYCERAQVSNPPKSTLGVYQDSNVSFHALLFSPSHLKFDRTSRSMRYLPMRKTEQPSRSFEVTGTQVRFI